MNENLIKNIKKVQDEFYANSKNNTFFNAKKNKNDCSEHVSQCIDLDKLISQTIFIENNSNKIFIDYTIFKTFASQLNYQTIVDSLVSKIICVKNTYRTFEIHLNLKSLTVSAIERYRPIFQVYYDTCCKYGLSYESDILDKFEIYHAPMVINSLVPIIVKYTDKSIKNKIVCNK